jgi:GR25 family glycosyltransferase involved in LPS biosynthesis
MYDCAIKTYPKVKIPAYVITLKDDISNLIENIVEKTEGRIEPIQRFEATNGKNPFIKVNSKFIDCFFNEYFAPPLLVAIADSHMRAWERFVEEGDPLNDNDLCIFFEDDVFQRRKDEAINNYLIDKAIGEFKEFYGDILYLGYFRSSILQFLMWMVAAARFPSIKPKKGWSCGTNEKLTERPALAIGFHAYVLSRRGALKLIRILKGKVNQYLDYKLQKLICKNDIRALAVKKRIFYQTSTATECEKEQFCGVGSSVISNTSSSCKTFPLLVTDHLLKNAKVDECVSGKYIVSNVIFHIFGSPYFKVTVTTLILFTVGIILAFSDFFRRNITFLIFVALIIGIPDFALSGAETINIVSIFFNIFALVSPLLFANFLVEIFKIRRQNYSI